MLGNDMMTEVVCSHARSRCTQAGSALRPGYHYRSQKESTSEVKVNLGQDLIAAAKRPPQTSAKAPTANISEYSSKTKATHTLTTTMAPSSGATHPHDGRVCAAIERSAAFQLTAEGLLHYYPRIPQHLTAASVRMRRPDRCLPPSPRYAYGQQGVYTKLPKGYGFTFCRHCAERPSTVCRNVGLHRRCHAWWRALREIARHYSNEVQDNTPEGTLKDSHSHTVSTKRQV